ncbi:MAG TPA: subclass B3 metallo-beta-lactamase [Rhodanobacteraceae bacterium]|jgi:metallo-beta-lactamase class B|nr:subclass B3 metallo-beta-lactamase [Rhodanobacteraceae bacterium]
MDSFNSNAPLRRMVSFSALIAILIALSNPVALAADATAATTDCKLCAEWNEPVEPFRIYGNAWYVGPHGLSSILITSDRGHILIDGALAESAPQIAANIRKLGFRVEDVKYILNSHAHFDHAGGIGALQKSSHATVVASADGAAAIERGRGDRGDPQFLSARSFPPVHHVQRIGDGETVSVGDITVTAHATPGHTPGGTTWTWKSCSAERCLDIVFADSLVAISDDVYRYSDEKNHPGIIAAFRRSIATVAALPCDILLSTHPDASDLWKRRDAAADGSGLIDRDACRQYADRASQRLGQRLANEKSAHP